MKSIVPMTHLSWNLARNFKATDPKLFEQIKRTLLRTLRQTALVQDLVEASLRQTIRWHGRSEVDPAPYCNNCEVNVIISILKCCRLSEVKLQFDCACIEDIEQDDIKRKI